MRSFVDSAGTRWDVWEVRPLGLHLDPEERRLADRHKLPPNGHPPPPQPPRPLGLAAALSRGWLVFRSASARRRLAPVPTDWFSASQRKLEAYCRRAIGG